MKKLIFIPLILFLFIGCSKDNNSNNPQSIDKTANLQSVGESANDFLANLVFTNLEIEIVYAEGHQPTQAAINGMISFINTYAHKSNINYTLTQIPSPGIDAYSIQDVANVERDNRTAYNEGNTLALFIYFADGSSDQDDGEGSVTLGAAFRNTSIVVYEKTAKELADKSSATLEDIETATLQHEMGHLFGLINLSVNDIHNGTADDHHDGVNHCNVANCLMNAEIEYSGGILGRLETGKGIPVLDALCIEDLQANGGK
jgi:uncharacterized protein YcfL